MKQTSRTRGVPAHLRGAPSLKMYPPPSDRDGERDIFINVLEPGRFRLRLWSEREMAQFAPDERPAGLMFKDGVWFVFDLAPSRGTV